MARHKYKHDWRTELRRTAKLARHRWHLAAMPAIKRFFLYASPSPRKCRFFV